MKYKVVVYHSDTVNRKIFQTDYKHLSAVLQLIQWVHMLNMESMMGSAPIGQENHTMSIVIFHGLQTIVLNPEDMVNAEKKICYAFNIPSDTIFRRVITLAMIIALSFVLYFLFFHK